MSKVVVASKYDKTQHKKFYTFHMFKRSFSIYFVMAIAAFAIYIAIKQTIANKDNQTSLAVVWALALATVFITPALMFIKVHSACKKEAQERKDSEEILEFTKDKVTRRIKGESNIAIGWYNIEAIYEVKDAFYIYLQDDMGLVAKKDCIVEGNIETLRKLAQNNLKPSKKGKIPFKKTYKGE